MSTGFLFHERYMWHNTGRHAGPFIADASGWSSPTTATARTRRRSAASATCSTSPACSTSSCASTRGRATDEELTRFHTPEYVEQDPALSARRRRRRRRRHAVSARGSYEIALLSAGGVIAAVDAVLDGDGRQRLRADAPARPPRDAPTRRRGFCLFGNIAIAVHHARAGARARAGRDRRLGRPPRQRHARPPSTTTPSVLTISLHQDGALPGRLGPGRAHRRGRRRGLQRSTCRCRRARATAPTRRRSSGSWCPALERFRPQLIVVASGLDASVMDPLAMMLLTSEGYRRMTDAMVDARRRVCDGKLVAIHEGGYSAPTSRSAAPP